MATMDDPALTELVVAARDGDRTAFGVIVERCYDEVAGFVAVRLPRREAIDEVVQATFVDAWLDLARFDADGALTAWLKGIARHRILRWQRDQQRGRRLVPVADRLAEPVEETDPAEDLARLRRCLDRLPAEARSVLAARHVQGEDLDRLAARLGSTVNALATRLCRWRSTLRTCIERAAGAA
jgi:RNA polymerase sigma-70 factor (ECF subfamily)